MAHYIVELRQLPRERAALQQLINQSKARMRRARMMFWAAVLCVVLGVGILVFFWPKAHTQTPAASMPLVSMQAVFVPFIYASTKGTTE